MDDNRGRLTLLSQCFDPLHVTDLLHLAHQLLDVGLHLLHSLAYLVEILVHGNQILIRLAEHTRQSLELPVALHGSERGTD
jgi:hypothetical protein